MARCERCDREGCQEDTLREVWYDCNCDDTVHHVCEHYQQYDEARCACAAHAVNWRERALKAEAELARFNAVQACNKPAPPEGE